MRFKWIAKAALAFAVMSVHGGPCANAELFIWVGDAGPDGAAWCNEHNWLFGTGYPGQRDTADVVLIRGVETQDPVVDCPPPFAISDLILAAGGGLTVADALSVAGGVSVVTGGRLSVSGTMEGNNLFVAEGTSVTVSGLWISCDLIIRAGSHVLVPGVLWLPCKLTIEPGGWLEVVGKGQVIQTGPVTNEIGGLFELASGFSTYRVDADVVLGPYVTTGAGAVCGNVKGDDLGAAIEIKRNHVLTNEITVKGKMTVRRAGDTGTARFKNGTTGVVKADGDAIDPILDFNGDVILDDDPGALWSATKQGAELRFNREAVELVGDFLVTDNATLKFLASITTFGCFEDNPRCGTVDASAAGVCFTANGCGGFTQCSSQSYAVGCP